MRPEPCSTKGSFEYVHLIKREETTVLRKRIRLYLVAALALTLVFGGVGAAFSANISGAITVSNSAPTVGGAVLSSAIGGDPITNLTPQTTYYLRFTVADANTLADLSSVVVSLHTGDSPGVTWDADSNAIYSWTETGWAMGNGGATTTWTLDGGSSGPGVLSAVSGDWVLAFKPGKLATAGTGNWRITVTAGDKAAASDSYLLTALTMNPWIEMTTSTSTVAFAAAPGGSGALTGTTPYVTASVTTNAGYHLDGRAGSSWTKDGGSMTLVDGPEVSGNNFALRVGNDAATGNFPNTGPWLTITDRDIVGGLGAPTTAPETAEGTADTDLYMGIILGQVAPGAYTGTITLTAVNQGV